MKRSKFTDDQIMFILEEAQFGIFAAPLCYESGMKNSFK